MKKVSKIYNFLLVEYGYQGWWPLSDVYRKTNNFYHPNNYNFPKNKKQRFEICLGCILTQNTSWKNVEIGIKNLKENKLFKSRRLLNYDLEKLKELIKPCGYYNQKTEYIIEFTKFYMANRRKDFARENLLKVKGVGPETADSMLLYAFKKPNFVVDTYTKRILLNLKICKEEDDYYTIQRLFLENINIENIKEKVNYFQEYHALLVRHAKKYYRRKEDYKKDPLINILK
ncbi:MAG: endonuclease III domain-containing protein [archaeon]|jgi:endonuclease-3 related protein|nr:endonuclease III domain-containing protein [archaeon]MDD2477474.1 endonuclease III domain-containing protein [Candidatus ainarchaeum sp.]MDD3084757.1 endonuclease III domain-containing protein [Candidatus ainarchaeum sp.]MDD4221006.1 endonuclease III domain-containing protein [Candidatus ainarchaeum sp.]MDD4662422.1 endonuclease III domain-containing protein [Candidatus ainarchaeum sp.]